VTSFNSFALNFVANALWQVAFVAAVAAFGAWLMLRSVSARYRHFVWVTALILSISLPLWSALPQERETRWMTFFSTPGAVSNLGAPLDITPIQAQPQQPHSDSIWRHLPFGAAFVGLYLLFLFYRIHKLWRAWKLSLEIRKSAFPVGISDTLREVLEHCRKTMGVGEVALVGSPSVAVPVTIGLRRPVIVLPESLLAETSAELLSAAIGHEMAHIKRRDFACNLIYELLFLPISFHPAAVLVKRRINETRELACDETVSELLLDAQVYARSLVSLANSSFSLDNTTYILGVNDADILEERVMRLIEKKPSAGTRRATAWLGITLFALTLSGAGVAAFPIKITQDKNSQDKNLDVATAKFFVGTWKGKIRPDSIIDHVMIFKIEGDKLTGTQRTPRLHINPEGEQRLLSDGYGPLPALTVKDKTLSWKIKNAEKPELEYKWTATLVSDDEILVEGVGGLHRPDKTIELAPLSFKLKKEK
jgi:beta-lactamase regulating signal transducer with metallopeptidase domain